MFEIGKKKLEQTRRLVDFIYEIGCFENVDGFFLMLFKAIRAFVSFSKGNIRKYVRIFFSFSFSYLLITSVKIFDYDLMDVLLILRFYYLYIW